VKNDLKGKKAICIQKHKHNGSLNYLWLTLIILNARAITPLASRYDKDERSSLYLRPASKAGHGLGE
jgi:protein associated with RNAse G/E